MDEVTLLRALTELIQADLPTLDGQDVDRVANDIAVWVREHFETEQTDDVTA